MGSFAKQFGDFYRHISGDIYRLCLAMNFRPTWQQAQMFDAVQAATDKKGPNWITIKSGQGPGKTTAAVIAALFRSLQAVNAMTVVTAPTMRQCREVWLAEARRLMERADPLLQKFIKVTKSKVEIAGLPDWGVKLMTAGKEEKAQGFHEKNMTVICEEASGVPREIVTQFKGTLSNPNAMFLMIGNPNTRDCAFFDTFYGPNKDRWIHFTFNAEDTARDYPDIVNPQRNKDLADEFGRDSDVYRVRVLGEFPFSDPNSVLSGEDVERCMDRGMLLKAAAMRQHEDQGGGSARQFGLDFARFGSDESTIFRRSGNAIVEWTFFSHVEPAAVVDRAFAMQRNASWKDSDCWYVADAGGIGQGVMHKFYDAQKQVLEFHNGGTAIDSEHYANKITEAFFHLSRLTKATECYLPKDVQLFQQLTTRQYYTNKKGQLILETKDEYAKRGYPSPDRADGCVMAMYNEVAAAGHISQRKVEAKRVGATVTR